MPEVLYFCGHSLSTPGPEDDPSEVYAELAGTKDYSVSINYCPECKAKIEGKQNVETGKARD